MAVYSGRFKTKQQTYLDDDRKTSRTVIHPLIEVDGEFVHISDTNSPSGLMEFNTRQEARQFALDYLEQHKGEVNESELWSEEEKTEADAAALRVALARAASRLEEHGDTETADTIRRTLWSNDVGKEFLGRAALNESVIHRLQNYFESLTKNESGLPLQIIEDAVAGDGADAYAEISDPFDSIMCVDDAAKLWGYHPSYIKNLCASGILRARKYGKTWIIDKRQGKPNGKKT